MRTVAWPALGGMVGLLGMLSVRADDATVGDVVDGCIRSETACGWQVGADLVALKPLITDNPAFATRQSAGDVSEQYVVTNFDYHLAASPRLWLAYRAGNEFGARSQLWIFDQEAQPLSASPPANGLGQIFPAGPACPNCVDLSSSDPTDRFAFTSRLRAYCVDAEVTKQSTFGGWEVLAAAGLRYGSVQQRATAQLGKEDGSLQALLDMDRRLEGLGPTVAWETRRPLGWGIVLFAAARGSVLFGQSEAIFANGADLNQGHPFQSTNRSAQDAVVPIGELRLGGEWWAPRGRWGGWFARSAWETQLWNEVGQAGGASGNLGFVGLSGGVGLAR